MPKGESHDLDNLQDLSLGLEARIGRSRWDPSNYRGLAATSSSLSSFLVE